MAFSLPGWLPCKNFSSFDGYLSWVDTHCIFVLFGDRMHTVIHGLDMSCLNICNYIIPNGSYWYIVITYVYIYIYVCIRSSWAIYHPHFYPFVAITLTQSIQQTAQGFTWRSASSMQYATRLLSTRASWTMFFANMECWRTHQQPSKLTANTSRIASGND